VLDLHRDQAARQGVQLIEHLEPAATAGDPGLIASLVTNLVDNAIRHNQPVGHVEITTRSSGPEVTLTVTNTGPVIPDDQIPRLLRPFQRLAPDRRGHRDGYGLGLAIVDAAARAHHATLTTSARPGGGLTVTVGFAPPPGGERPPARPRSRP
jgi:signal transduction histidine kinase